MPVYVSAQLAGGNSDLGNIPAPPTNKRVTKIDWCMVAVSAASAACCYTVAISATGGVGGIATGTEIPLATVMFASSSAGQVMGNSFYAKFGDGIIACGIGSSVHVLSRSIGGNAVSCSTLIGYHYE